MDTIKFYKGFCYVNKRVDLKFEIKTTLINCKTRVLFSNYIKSFILNLAKYLHLFIWFTKAIWLTKAI
ncbi:hypothetical protein BGI05_05700 [Snodgrassella alvi]|nr:hypothetical protein BGH98_02145 [Snodgrassella alvi]ORF12381.1 hypothetical protein BGI00_05845 [Snodgrassella alvi]ORF12662.1 hypothetical protein BGI01_06405 [Snodgrassella alvi]ORF15310.1 hypothetical protein BGI02_03480 [Snodgrassella alvi]ORF19310.1 hypothetical protein BGI03_04525 [Snodgrassella alvi]